MTLRLALDGGHGADTAGKRTPKFTDGTFMHEHEFNYATAEHVANILNSDYQDVVILKTYESKRDVPLTERTNKANEFKADLFLSIHANAIDDVWQSTAGGIETFAYKTKPTNSTKIATKVQEELIAGTGLKNRGVKFADFAVLRQTHMDAILCECGFMDNKAEAELLRSDAYRQKVAKAIVKALVAIYGLKAKPKPVAPAPKPQATVTPTNGKLYRVQVGAFGSKANAEALAAKLKSAGYPSTIKYE